MSISKNTLKRFNVALAKNIVQIGEVLTDASGNVAIDRLTDEGVVLVTLSEDPGNDLVFSHTIVVKGQFTVYIKDASASTPISASILANKKIFYFIING